MSVVDEKHIYYYNYQAIKNLLEAGGNPPSGGFSLSMKIAAKKLGMTQIWKDDRVVPVTVLKVESKEVNLEEGTRVTISGLSKGKGFQGVVKRHGFGGGPKSHGQKDRLRAPGSIGSTAPQRVPKGRKMAGHMGLKKITLKGVQIERVMPEEKRCMVRGAVPGMRGTKIEIRT